MRKCLKNKLLRLQVTQKSVSRKNYGAPKTTIFVNRDDVRKAEKLDFLPEIQPKSLLTATTLAGPSIKHGFSVGSLHSLKTTKTHRNLRIN